jgi:hypothetical protein
MLIPVSMKASRAFMAMMLGMALCGASAVQAQMPYEEVFDQPVSDSARVWLDDAVEGFNLKMQAFARDWLVGASEPRTDLRRRLVVFQVAGGRLAFDARMIGTFSRRDGAYVWVWGWSNPNVAINFRLPAAKLEEAASSLQLPMLSTGRYFVRSRQWPFLVSAVVLKTHEGVGIQRIRVLPDADVYYLLSNPRRETDPE